MKKVAFFTLGCKVNQYETEAISENFLKNDYEVVDFEDVSDVYIINTCTVTSLSDKKCRQMIRRAKKNNENAVIVAVGCYVQNDPEAVKAIDGVNVLVGTNHKNQIVDLVEEYMRTNMSIEKVDEFKDLNAFEELEISHTSDRTRAYLKIQEGCNQFCSYCIIPYVRGKIRSRDLENIKKEVIRLTENGFKEIVLTGIHVASYGKDLNSEISLIDVIEQIAKVEKLKRIRLSSIEPRIVTEDFMERLSKTDKICDHFHLSLQSGSEKVLKEMNRKYTKAEYKDAVRMIRKYMEDAAITTDVIVGFPGETGDEFVESMEFVKDIKFSDVHVFSYSNREGTVASKRVDQIENKVKQERSKKLIEEVEKLKIEFLNKFIGTTMEVLFEEERDGFYIGHSKNYIKVKIKTDKNIKNELYNVIIESVEKDFLVANLC